MSAHTPGPWRIGRHLGSPSGVRLIHKDVGDKGQGVPIIEGFVSIEDARLIAAAPELLEACVAMIEWDEREKDHAVDFHARMALCDAAFQKARAAIAKAEGQS